MSTAKESLRQRVEQLSENEALELLSMLPAKEPQPLTLAVIKSRLAGKRAYRIPPEQQPPFRKFERVECSGILASELLIADRR
jgi:hypothetical protein